MKGHPAVVQRLASVAPSDVAIPQPVVAEITAPAATPHRCCDPGET